MRHPAAARIEEICRKRDALDLDLSRLLQGFDADRGYEADGCANTVAWLRFRCRRSTSAALEALTVARRLPELPQVEKAVETGEIGFSHAAVIAESAERVGSELLFDRQDELVRKAEQVDPASLRIEVRRVEHEVDAEQSRRQAEWLHRSRRLQVKTLGDGRVQLDGMLDPEGGAVLKTALDAALGPRSKTEARSEQQRRADALVDVAQRGLEGRRFGETGCQRPHLNLTVELETLLGLQGGAGSIAGVGPVTLETIKRHLCDASLSLTVLMNGEPVMTAGERRTFSASMRRSLALKQQHCQWPAGCDRPVQWCEGHHLLAWLLKGRTTLPNGALLCGYHHRLCHEGGWSLERGQGELVAVPPDNRRYRSTKAPPAA